MTESRRRPPRTDSRPESWREILGTAARAIRKATPDPIGRTDAQKMARYFVSVLVPRRPPGRKPTPEVAKALAMKLEGEPWRAIYAAVFEDYSNMPGYERNWRCYRLRRAVAASVKRRRLLK